MATPKRSNSDHALLIVLACGATVEAAARQLGISERAVYRRKEKPAFQRQLQELKASMVDRASSALVAAAMEAVKTLLELLKAATPPATRHAAARSVIELGVKLREFAELEQRILALEEQLQQSNSRA